MSVLIKGMAMPPHCGICTLNNGTFCYAVEGKEHESEDIEDYADICERPKWCPLVEIPKHGRLIDADAIQGTHAIARCLDDGHNWNELCVTMDEIVDMPTIIEGDTE